MTAVQRLLVVFTAFLCIFCCSACNQMPSISSLTPAPESAMARLETIEIQSTNARGYAWDPFGGAPDPYVVISSNRGTIRTRHVPDTFRAEYSQQLFTVRAGDSFRVVVWDGDIDADDLIGETTVTITESMLREGKAVLSFGGVKAMTLLLTAK